MSPGDTLRLFPERTKIELLMADGEALPAILSAAGDSSGPGGRAGLLDVLARIYVREGERRSVATPPWGEIAVS
jgi:hypothetical protein